MVGIAAQVGEGVLCDTRDLGESWIQVSASANTLEVPPMVGHSRLDSCAGHIGGGQSPAAVERCTKHAACCAARCSGRLSMVSVILIIDQLHGDCAYVAFVAPARCILHVACCT